MRQKWVLACPSFGECTARVKLELTDFRSLTVTFFLNSQLNAQPEIPVFNGMIKKSYLIPSLMVWR